MELIDKLAWISFHDGAVLCVRPLERQLFYLPGGKREAGETDVQALFREVREELTVILRTETIQHLTTFETQADGRAAGVTVRMTCYGAEYTGSLEPASEIEELAWFRYADRERLSHAGKLLFDWLKDKSLLR